MNIFASLIKATENSPSARIVSTDALTEIEIAIARSCDRLWVDPETMLGWVIFPGESKKAISFKEPGQEY